MTKFLGALILMLCLCVPAWADSLLQSTNFTYLGAFKVPYQSSGCDGNYSNGYIAYYPTDNSLFLNGGNIEGSCTTGSQVGEIAIPSTLSSNIESVYANIPAATFLQAYYDVTNGQGFNTGPGGTADGGSLKNQGGILVYDGNKLIGSTVSNYDTAPATNEFNSFWTHSVTVSDSSFAGMFGLNILSPESFSVTSRFSNGFLASIPTAYQSQLGGKVMGGNGGRSIQGTTTEGPSMVVFDPDSLGSANTSSSASQGASTLLLGYPYPNFPAGWSAYWNSDGSTASSAVIVPGTRTVLFFGTNALSSCVPMSGNSPTTLAGCGAPVGSANAANFGQYCYGGGTSNLSEQCSAANSPWGPNCVPNVSVCSGTTLTDTLNSCCYDPTSTAKGAHAWPFLLAAWAYDIGDSSGNNTSGNSTASNVSNSGATLGGAGNNPSANNLTAVKLGNLNPNDVYPYALWYISLPWLQVGNTLPIGATYDSVNNKLYLSAAQLTEAYHVMPVIAVFSVNVSSSGPTHHLQIGGVPLMIGGQLILLP